MIILVFFSFLAGIVTVVSPCVLPVLPILLGAGFDSGRQRAWGIIFGFLGCFSLAILTFTQAVHLLGASIGNIQFISGIFLFLFGLILLVPFFEKIIFYITSPLVKFGEKISSRTSRSFMGGMLLGVALGFIWTPCAGPILATVIALSSMDAISITTTSMTVAYALGALIPMLLIMHGSSFLKQKTLRYPKILILLRSIFGLLTCAAALAVAAGWSTTFQQEALEYIPLIKIENNRFVRTRLAKLVKDSVGKNYSLRIEDTSTQKEGSLPMKDPAPEFPSDLTWFNSKPLTLKELKGKVVLIDFWTYSCINCIRTLPHLNRLYSHYKDKNLIIIGVHTPEFSFEKLPDNVLAAIQQFKIAYPIVLDNDYSIWRAYGNLYWPAHYLIDQQGMIRYTHFGEGKYLETENTIRSLLGLMPLTGIEERTHHRAITSEIYLGYERAQAYPYDFEIYQNTKHHYSIKESPEADQVSLEGDWIIGPESIKSTSSNSFIHLNFVGTQVHLVLDGKSKQPIEVLLDGKPVPAKYYSSDMNSRGEIIVKESRKYDIISLRNKYGRYRLKIKIPEGISAFAFTFGEE